MQNNEYTAIIRYIQIYLFGTVVLYLIGPISWKTRNSELTFTLITLYILALGFGNKYGERRSQYSAVAGSGRPEFVISHFTMISIITLLLQTLLLIRIVMLYSYSGIFYILENLVSGNYSSLYFAEKTVSIGAQMFGGLILSLFALLFSPITRIYPVLFLVYLKELKFYDKVLGIITLIVWIFKTLSQGTTESLLVIIVYALIPLLLKTKRGVTEKSRSRKRKYPIVKFGKYRLSGNVKWKSVVIIMGAVLILIAFNAVMSDRTGGTHSFSQLGENYVSETNNFLYNIIPVGLRELLIWVDFYICQGYYGMSLATTLSWHPMFGLGSSRWLCSEIDAIIPGLYHHLYSVRIEEAGYRWSDMANWHSAFTWFANDVSFIGVILVMFLIGWLFAKVYRDAIENKSPYAIGAMACLLEMLIFLPCNNILYANSQTLFPFVLYLVMWKQTSRKII